VRIADGPPQRIKDEGQQHLPGEEAWLIGEHRSSGEKTYHLANLPAEMDLRQLAATVKAQWICEQAHQQLEEELLQHRRIAKASRKKRITGRHLSQASRPFATPSSVSFFGYHVSDVRTAITEAQRRE
jgi:SRSO17 transposase